MSGPPGTPGPAAEAATEVVRRLAGTGGTLAVAESLTGGALCAAVVDVPGASAVLRGGVVAYATELKGSVLGVPAALLEARGPVDPGVAVAMAAGAARLLGAGWGVATTGVAGPAEQDGHPVGTVHVAVAGPVPGLTSLRLTGDRAEVRAGAVQAALSLLLSCLAAARDGAADGTGGGEASGRSWR